MDPVDRQDFMKFVKLQEGKELRTLKLGRTFTVSVTKTGVEYTPMSTMKPRPHQAKVIDRILDYFEETNSFNTREYQSFTANSSYTLSLIKLYLAQRGSMLPH